MRKVESRKSKAEVGTGIPPVQAAPSAIRMWRNGPAPRLRHVLLALALAATMGPSPAQNASPVVSGNPAALSSLKVGFVDLDLVFDQSVAIKRAIERADSEMDGRARRLRELQRSFRDKQQQLDTQGTVLSDDQRRRLQGEAVALMDEMDDLQVRIERDLRDRQRRTIDPILKEVLRIVAVVGEREGYDMVLRGDAVLYGRNTTDLTAVVFRELDARADELLAAAGPGRDPSANDTQTSGTTRRADPPKRLEPLNP